EDEKQRGKRQQITPHGAIIEHLVGGFAINCLGRGFNVARLVLRELEAAAHSNSTPATPARKAWRTRLESWKNWSRSRVSGPRGRGRSMSMTSATRPGRGESTTTRDER